jgi:hypothetical protein
MTRTEAINLLTARLAYLPDQRIEMLAELADAYSRPSFFSTMTGNSVGQFGLPQMPVTKMRLVDKHIGVG